MYIKNKEILEKEFINIKTICCNLIDNSKNGIDIEIKKHKTKRSNLQNRFYWANCSDVALFLNEAGMKIEKAGIKCSWKQEDIHEVNKIKSGVDSTTKLSVSDFCDYMDRFFAFWIAKTKGCWQPKELTRSYAERTGLI